MNSRLLLAVGWGVLFMAAGLMAYTIPLDSDRLYFDALFADLAHGGHWKDWRLPFAPGYFPDLLLYRISFDLLPSPIYRMWFVSAAQALACAAAAAHLLRQVDAGTARQTVPAALVVLALAMLVSTQTHAWIFLGDNNAHVAAPLCALLSTACMIRWLRDGEGCSGWRPAAWLVFVGWVGALSSQVYVLTFSAPALLFCFYWGLRYPRQRRTLVRCAAAIGLGMVGSSVIRRHIVFNSDLAQRIPSSLLSARISLATLGRTVEEFFRQPPAGLLLTLLLSAATIACWAWARAHSRGRLAEDAQSGPWPGAMAVFATITGIATLGGSVASGGFMDVDCFRYMPFALGMSVLASILFLARSHRVLLGLSTWMLAGMALLYAGHLYPRPEGWSLDAVARQHPRLALQRYAAQCVEEAARSSAVPLQAGASQYWLVRGVQHYLPAYPMFALQSDLTPFFWMSSIGPIRRPEHYRYFFNFMVVQTKGDTEQFKFTVDNLRQVAPPPSAVHRCGEDGRAEVWIYADDSLDRAIRQKAANYLPAGR